MQKLTLSIQPRAPVGLDIESRKELSLELENGHSVDWYSGSYEVTPTRQEQSLPTRSKVMREDVVVHEIPWFETANPYGKTFVIGE